MREAKITCLVRSHNIADLDRVLTKGEVVYLPADIVENSLDLKEARRIRAVHIQWVQRCQQVKDPPAYVPPYVQRMKGKPFPKESFSEPEIPPGLEWLVRKVISEEFAVFKQELVDLLRSGVSAFPPRITITNVAEGQEITPHATPTFVPSGIVREGIEASVSVQKETSQKGDLDKAAQALRVAKKS